MVTPLRLVPDSDRTTANRADLLRAALRNDFLTSAGWAPDREVLARRVITLCWGYENVRLSTARRISGLTPEEFAQKPSGKRMFGQRPCKVAECGRVATVADGLCSTHCDQGRRTDLNIEQFATTANAFPANGPCTVVACSREAESRVGSLCQSHRVRWSTYRKRHPSPDFDHWRRVAHPINADYFVIFEGLAEVVQLELLVALQARTDTGTESFITSLRAIASALRRNEATTIYDLNNADVTCLRSDAAVMLRSIRTLLDRQLSTPETERDSDVWDLGVFGFAHWKLSFSDVRQPWLVETAKRWTEDDLPHHRGRQGGGTAKTVVAAVTALSECLHETRGDGGTVPADLGRRDIVALTNRLAHKERTGEITAKTRLSRCRYLKRFFTTSGSWA